MTLSHFSVQVQFSGKEFYAWRNSLLNFVHVAEYLSKYVDDVH